MAITVIYFDEATSLTTNSNDYLLDGRGAVCIAAILESGSPTTGAKLQFSIDDKEAIKAGTAKWLDAPAGYQTDTFADSSLGCITGIRLQVTDGTWTLQVRQSINPTIEA